MRRRIKSVDVQFLSLVPRGANRLPVLYKSEDKTVDWQPLCKFDAELGELLAVAYPAESRDSQGDIASADVVRKMAHSFAKNGAKIDIRHKGVALTKDQVYVAENFIVQKGDARFEGWKDYSGQPVNLTGAWATVLKIEDETLRKAYRDGEWQGVSFMGPAELLLEKDDPKIGELLDALAKKMQGKEDVVSITADELKKILDERDARLVETVKKALQPEQPPKAPEKPPVEFDPLDPKQVEERLAKIEREQAAKQVDWNDPDSIRAYRDSLKKAPETSEQKAERLEKEATALREKLKKAQGASTLPPSTGTPPAPQGDQAIPGFLSVVSKEEQSAWKGSGSRMAALLNK